MTHARDCAGGLGVDGTRPPVNPNKANLQRSNSRELRRTAQPLRRQRGAYVGFDDCDIRGTDCAISVHVLAEIPSTNVLTYLRFGQSYIGGIDRAVSVHVTNQNAHRNVHIDSRLIARAIHSVDLDVD